MGRKSSDRVRFLGRLQRWDAIGVTSALVVLLILMAVFRPSFFTADSLIQLVRGASLVGLIAYGMVFLLSMQEIDLSVGSNYAVCMVVGALAAKAGINPWIAGLMAIGTGALLGALNGALANLFRLPTILVTLGTISVYRGIVLVLTPEGAIAGFPVDSSFFSFLGNTIAGLPTIVWALVIVGVVLNILYRSTPFGVRVRAIGSNVEAAKFSGLPVRWTRLQAMILVGALVGLSGAIMLAFFQSADPGNGTDLELQVLAAAIVGGTALSGGAGTLAGALLGALLINTINTALILFGLPSTWSTFVTGTVIVLAVCLDSTLRNNLLRRR